MSFSLTFCPKNAILKVKNMSDQNNTIPSSPEKRESSPLDQNLRPSEKEYRLGIRVEKGREGAQTEKKLETESKWQEARIGSVEATVKKEKISTAPAIAVRPSVQPKAKPPKTVLQRQIEKILSEDLAEVYNSMDEQHKKEFREEGERVSSGIEQLLKQAKVKVREIMHLIKKWLGKIPGVNKFFMIQEAKIKTDKILTLRK